MNTFDFYIYCYTHLVDTQHFRFPIEMNPFKLLVSVTHNTEFIRKEMEAELSRGRELLGTYKKRSLMMMRELHAKEMQIKTIERINQSGMLYVCQYSYYFIHEFIISGS